MVQVSQGTTLIQIYDPVKVARSIAYHQKEIERATKLLSNKYENENQEVLKNFV
jgi:hypothetical protein